MKRLTTALLLLISILSFAQDRTLSAVEVELQRLIQDAGLRHGELAFAAVNLDNGKVIADHNIARSMIPASLMKLPTTWVAMESLGADYRFKTTIEHTGAVQDGVLKGNIIIHGQGDPTLGSRYMTSESVMNQIKSAFSKAGIKKVDGKIILNLSTFTPHSTPAGWTWEDMGNYFGASPTPLIWHDNLIELYLNSGQVGSQAMLAKPWPENSAYQLSFDITAADDNRDNAWFFSAPKSNMIYGKGTIPAFKQNFLVKISDPDPVQRFVDDFKCSLDIAETPVEIRFDPYPVSDATTLLTIQSPPLIDIVTKTNHQSINLYAEALNLAIDTHNMHKTIEGGIETTQSYFKKHKVTTAGIRQIDGSGISPMNRLTAQCMIDLLTVIYRDDQFQQFNESLPVGGESGTVQYYFKTGKAKGNLRAKSGSMHGVKNYAGYVTNKYDETIAFCIMMNDYDEDRKAALMQKVERVMEAVIIN